MQPALGALFRWRLLSQLVKVAESVLMVGFDTASHLAERTFPLASDPLANQCGSGQANHYFTGGIDVSVSCLQCQTSGSLLVSVTAFSGHSKPLG